MLLGLLGNTGEADAATLGLGGLGGVTFTEIPSNGQIQLTLLLDTQGLSLEGFHVGIDFSGGLLSILDFVHAPLPGLFPDVFGTPSIDNDAQTIRGINQTTFTTPLPPGIYTLGTVRVQTTQSQRITATPGLFGEVLGVGGGACPGTAAGCTVSISRFRMVPEPGTAFLMLLGLLSLPSRARPQRASGQPHRGRSPRRDQRAASAICGEKER